MSSKNMKRLNGNPMEASAKCNGYAETLDIVLGFVTSLALMYLYRSQNETIFVFQFFETCNNFSDICCDAPETSQ